MTIELLKLVASVFPGITVASFNERFGACTDEEIRAYTLQQMRIKTRFVVTSKGVERV